MKCQACKTAEATVHFTEVVDDQVIKLHLCLKCAQAKGVHLKPDITVGDLLPGAPAAVDSEEDGDEQCPGCGLSLREFRRQGRLGCGQCYQAFGEKFLSLLSALHKGERHRGKVPSAHPPGTPSPDLRELKKSLRQAVEKEQFEAAARLCELIKKREEKGPAGPPPKKISE